MLFNQRLLIRLLELHEAIRTSKNRVASSIYIYLIAYGICMICKSTLASSFSCHRPQHPKQDIPITVPKMPIAKMHNGMSLQSSGGRYFCGIHNLYDYKA